MSSLLGVEIRLMHRALRGVTAYCEAVKRTSNHELEDRAPKQPFFCQSFDVSDPDLDMPISTLLRPAQVTNLCHFSIAQQRLIHC